MSKIKELLESDKTVYFFDVDGVLAPLEYGEYNHYLLNDEDWAEAIKSNNMYSNIRPFKTFQKFISNKDVKRVFVISKVNNYEEWNCKIDYCNKNYGILKNHVFGVDKNEDKVKKMMEIKQSFPELEDKYFVMVEDTVDVLNDIMNNSQFSTIHVSSFME